MELYTNLSQRVLDLEKIKTSQAAEITGLKERVKQLEKKRGSRTHRLKRLRKGKKIADIDDDAKVTLIDETQERNDNLVYDTGVLDDEEVFVGHGEVEKEVSVVDPVTTVGEVVTTVSVEVTTASATTTVDELTLAQTLIEIKAAKPKVVTTAATTTTTAVTRPKAKGVIFQEPSEFTTTTSPSQPSQLPQAKDKGKAKMIEPKKPLKMKEQIRLDKELALKLQAEEEEDRLAREKAQQVEEANMSWDNVQAMMEADRLLAERLQ
ncbi:hypothetical protein Tco_1233901 [Tanacetum coccineum]